MRSESYLSLQGSFHGFCLALLFNFEMLVQGHSHADLMIYDAAKGKADIHRDEVKSWRHVSDEDAQVS